MSENFSVGTKVRVRFEGEVVKDDVLDGLHVPEVSAGFVRVKDALGTVHLIWGYSRNIETIEPEYEPGEHYIDANGNVYKRVLIGRGWWIAGSTRLVAHAEPTRPLRKLVPAEA